MLRRRRQPADDQWVLATGEYDGHPIITRFDHGLRKQAGRSRPIRVGVAVEVTAPDERGFPAAPDEGEQLAGLEERIVEEAADHAVLVGVITTNGTREWVLYADASEWIESFHHALDDATPGYDVQVMAERDPGWSIYKAFV